MSRVPRVPGLNWVNVNRARGVFPHGSRDSSAALSDLVAAALDEGCGDFYFDGAYRMDGFVGDDGMRHGLEIPFATLHDLGPRVRFHGQARFMAGHDDMMLVRWAASRGGWNLPEDSIQFDPNGHREVWGVGIVPQSMTQTDRVVHQSWITMRGHRAEGLAEGFVLQPGPRVHADDGKFTDSSCSYITLDGRVHSCRRGVWLKEAVNECTGNNANTIAGVIGHGECNTGIQIDAGSGTTITAHLEGILDKGGVPSETATGVYIANADRHGLACSNTLLWGVRTETIDCELHNLNPDTYVAYGFWRRATWKGVMPKVYGIERSWAPECNDWYEYGEGSAPMANGYVGLKKEIADAGLPWQRNRLVKEDLSNVAHLAPNTTIGSVIKVLGGDARWVMRFSCAAETADGKILCNASIAPPAFMINAMSFNPWGHAGVINNRGIFTVTAGFTDDGRLFIDAPPAGWDKDTATNHVHLNLSYPVNVPA